MNAIWKPAAVGNYQKGRAQKISRITFHHIVGDAPAAISRFQTPGVEVSANYVIGSDGILYQCVGEENTSYCDGNPDSNQKTISIEHAGGTPQVPYTEAMYRTSIALVRDLIQRYGITDFKRHRDVIDKSRYPGGTACSGSLDVERIIREAQGEEMVDKTNLPDLVRGFLMREPNNDDNVHLGKTYPQAIFDFIHSPQRGEVSRKWESIPQLEAKVADLTHKLNVVQASNGDATKWQTLKTLLKELIS